MYLATKSANTYYLAFFLGIRHAIASSKTCSGKYHETMIDTEPLLTTVYQQDTFHCHIQPRVGPIAFVFPMAVICRISPYSQLSLSITSLLTYFPILHLLVCETGRYGMRGSLLRIGFFSMLSLGQCRAKCSGLKPEEVQWVTIS